MDVAVAIDAESVEVTHRARTPGGYDNRGNAVGGTFSTDAIRAAIQPVKGSDLRDLPEGLREDISYVAWTRALVALKDEIIYEGSSYRIGYLWPRPMDGFRKLALARIET